MATCPDGRRPSLVWWPSRCVTSDWKWRPRATVARRYRWRGKSTTPWTSLRSRTLGRVGFCYRSARTDARRLVGLLADTVVGAMALQDRERLSADTLVFVASRSESNTFPYGFFQASRLNRNLGRFELFGWQK